MSNLMSIKHSTLVLIFTKSVLMEVNQPKLEIALRDQVLGYSKLMKSTLTTHQINSMMDPNGLLILQLKLEKSELSMSYSIGLMALPEIGLLLFGERMPQSLSMIMMETTVCTYQIFTTMTDTSPKSSCGVMMNQPLSMSLSQNLSKSRNLSLSKRNRMWRLSL